MLVNYKTYTFIIYKYSNYFLKSFFPNKASFNIDSYNLNFDDDLASYSTRHKTHEKHNYNGNISSFNYE